MPSGSFIVVRDSQIPVLIAFYEAEVDRLSKEVESGASMLRILQEKHLDAMAMLATLKGEKDQPNTKELAKESIDTFRITAYPNKGSWWEKIRWSLIDKQKVLSARDIMDCIYTQEPLMRVGGKESDKKISINIFSTLTNKYKEKDLLRCTIRGEFKYGFRNWFTTDGEHVLPQFNNEEKIDTTNDKAMKEFIRQE